MGKLSALTAMVGVSLGFWGCAGGHRPAVTNPNPPPEAREQAAEASQPASEPGSGSGIVHVVGPGQTLWRIARVYGLTLAELARINGVEDPEQLETGRRLLIPGATELKEVPAYPAPLPPADAATGGNERQLSGDLAVTTGQPGFAWPVAGGELLSRFGSPRRGRGHKGVDIRGRHGQAVLAAADGKVVYSGSSMRGYGKTIILEHGQGLRTLYAHNSELLVRRGQRVERGQPIARVGRTGNATTEHCHFEVRRHGVPVDPMPYLPGTARSSG